MFPQKMLKKYRINYGVSGYQKVRFALLTCVNTVSGFPMFECVLANGKSGFSYLEDSQKCG